MWRRVAATRGPAGANGARGARDASPGSGMKRAAVVLALGGVAAGCDAWWVPPPATSWDDCTGPGQCVALQTGCCGVCGAPTLADVTGVNAERIERFRADTCRDPDPVCPECASMDEPNLVAFCVAEECTAIDVRLDELSACTADSDCMLRDPACCESCRPVPETLVALATAHALEYRLAICPPDAACPACWPIYPAGWEAVCGADGHCAVAERAGCPDALPAYGAACTGEGLVCEYGLDLRPGCRTHATCESGLWTIAISGCPPLPGPGEDGCPLVPPAGGLCASDGLLCDMGGGTVCACAQCAGGPCTLDPRWVCARPPTTPGCPAVAPALGTDCAGEGLLCVYGVCGTMTSAGRLCQGGDWQDDPIACPL